MNGKSESPDRVNTRDIHFADGYAEGAAHIRRRIEAAFQSLGPLETKGGYFRADDIYSIFQELRKNG